MAKKKIDEDELKAMISQEISDAQTYQDTDITRNRVKAMEYYNGVMKDTPADPAWSQVVSRDVSDVIGWVLPGVVRVFTASDRIVDFQPEEENDEAFTEQASDYINYAFWVDNPGYRVLWDSTHDSLLMADGIVKTWWDDTKEYRTTVYSGLIGEQIAMLMSDETVEQEIVEQKQGPSIQLDVPPEEQPPQMGPDGQPIPTEPQQPQTVEVPTYDIKVKRVTKWGKLRFKAIEPENFLIDRDALTVDTARFVAQRDPHVTRSDLIRMGFDKTKVEEIPRYDGIGVNTMGEELARNPIISLSDSNDKAMDNIELYECYIRMDVNGDGIAEVVRVYFAGNGSSGTILEFEEYDDEVPFDNIPCEPVPHRFASRSLAGEVMDIQRIKTVLFRQALDNTYQVNNPQKDVEADSVINMDELVNPTVGGTVFRKAGSQPVNYNVVPSILPNALAAIDAMNGVIEMRTGVSRATMALDPEALQNQTATANQNQRDSAYSQIELIARNQSELGWKNVFAKALRVTVKHQDRPRTIRLRDKWVEVDPRQWNSNMDAVINTGLGTGSRDRDLMMLTQISAGQKELAAGLQAVGMTDVALDMVQKIVKTSVKGTEAAGLRNAADYWPEITDEQIQQAKQTVADQAGQPSPEDKAAQAKIAADTQIKQADMQMKAQQAQQQQQIDAQKMQMEFQLKREQMIAEQQLKREQTQAELQLKREQLQAELLMSQQQWEAEFQLQKEQAAAGLHIKAQAAQSKSSNVRPGGEPG